jgi:ParB family chromosome partitioning protein
MTVVPAESVVLGKRHRKDHGDLAQLADSIAEQGLLQPIGITEDFELVFGERRLLACRDILGLAEIEARVVNVTSLVEGDGHAG